MSFFLSISDSDAIYNLFNFLYFVLFLNDLITLWVFDVCVTVNSYWDVNMQAELKYVFMDTI